MTQITHNLAAVRQRIVTAARSYGRSAESVRLLAVSKKHSIEAIAALTAENQLDFGENFANEALEKQQKLPDSLRWHFIGRVQANKARQIASHFDWVHSVDRARIAQRLHRFRGTGVPLNVLIQVNFQDDEARNGALPDQVEPLAALITELSGLRLRGLMTMAPPTADFSEQSDCFARAHDLLNDLQKQGYTVDELSMGMSADMEAAIANGATWVRIGTEIFGKRDPD